MHALERQQRILIIGDYDADGATSCALAVKALRAALDMMKLISKMQPEWKERGLPRIDIGIGLNSGIVNVGNFGSDQRFNYLVFCDQ